MSKGREFYEALYPHVVQAMKEEGIDPAWAPITTSQAMIETSWGKSPATAINNFFGMKAAPGQKSRTFSTREGYGKNTVRINDAFLAFPSLEEGVRAGVRRLKDKFRAFEGTPSAGQYVRNINRNPKALYFTGDPELYERNLAVISGSPRAATAHRKTTEQERRIEKATWDDYANNYLSQYADNTAVTSNAATEAGNTMPVMVNIPDGNYVQVRRERIDPVPERARNAFEAVKSYNRLASLFDFSNASQPSFEVRINGNGGSLKGTTWDSIPMKQKSEVINLAVQNGIYDLDTIRNAYNEFASGGSIHIDPSKKGTFTAAASKHGKSVQEFASQVLAHPENYSPAMRKKANFARNASKWKHGLGGNLFAPGGEIEDEEYKYATTYLPEVTVTPTRAQKEQAWKKREGNIAKSLVSHPTLPNLFSAAEHYANSIPGLFSVPSEITGVTASEPLLPDVKNAAQLMKVGKVARAIGDAVKTGKNSFRTAVSNIFKKPAKKPDIIWDAEQMFKDGNNFSYTQKDIDILNSFIPEYKEIEKLSKANGTYLKMPDGSTWKGDSREWVIAQSKNVKDNYGSEILTHGNSDSWITKEGTDVTGDILGEKTLWTSTNPYLGGTYGNKRYRFVVPKDAKVETVADAHGRYWRDVKPGVDTNMMVYPNLTEDKIIRINNVVDRGPNEFFKEELPKAFPKEGVMDYTARVFQGDDLVLGNKVRRKALLGNNGMFDINNPNIFKGLIPAGFGIAGYKYSKSNENK